MKSLSSGRSKRRLELHFGGDISCPEPRRPLGTHAAPLGRRAPRCACRPRVAGGWGGVLPRSPGGQEPPARPRGRGAQSAVLERERSSQARASRRRRRAPAWPTTGRSCPGRAPVTVSSVSTPACPPLVFARLHQARASSHTPFLPSRVYHARFPAAQIPPPARCLLQCPEDGPRHPGGPGPRSPARVPVTPARVPRPTSGLTRSPRPRKAARPPTRRSAPPFRAGGRFVWRSLLASGLGGKRDCAGVAPGREWPGSGGWATPLKVHVNARAHGA